MPRPPGDSWFGLGRSEQLDVLLATDILDGGRRGQRLLDFKLARDASWIVGLLGLRGVHVTLADVESSLRGTSGRWLPGHTEFEVIRGVRRAIDQIDDHADRGELPNGDGLVDLFRTLTARIPALRDGYPRQGEPWDRVPGVDHPPVQRLPEGLSSFEARTGYLGDAARFRTLHPLAQGAQVLRAAVRLSPFADFNLILASLAASWYLMARGYPPFLPQATDRAVMGEVLAGGVEALHEWFAAVVLVGYKALCFAADGRW